MEYKERLIAQSNYWYNDGLKRAKIRDLSGAVTSLTKSLQCNRVNIDARNLLGLVYYGRGEIPEALVQWIISKNFKSHENMASYYLQKIQDTPKELEAINQAIHRYNQCLTYASQNGDDMAVIQLRKVIGEHPTFLKAYQLLGLLYIKQGQYSKARQVLRKANKLDVTNETTLRYMHELSNIKQERAEKTREERGQDEHSVSYQVGNELIIQPVATGLKDNTVARTILTGVGSFLLGAAMVFFLIMPSINATKTQVANASVIQMSDTITTQDNQIAALKSELESYRSGTNEAVNAIEKAKSTQENYEKLIYVYRQYLNNKGSSQDMAESLLSIDKTTLAENAVAIYDKISKDLFPNLCEKYYKKANSNIRSKYYTTASEYLEKLIKMDPEYDKGYALKLLADCYVELEKNDLAKPLYEKLVTEFIGTDAAAEAQEALDKMRPGADSSADTSADTDEEPEDGQNPEDQEPEDGIE